MVAARARLVRLRRGRGSAAWLLALLAVSSCVTTVVGPDDGGGAAEGSDFTDDVRVQYWLRGPKSTVADPPTITSLLNADAKPWKTMAPEAFTEHEVPVPGDVQEALLEALKDKGFFTYGQVVRNPRGVMDAAKARAMLVVVNGDGVVSAMLPRLDHPRQRDPEGTQNRQILAFNACQQAFLEALNYARRLHPKVNANQRVDFRAEQARLQARKRDLKAGRRRSP